MSRTSPTNCRTYPGRRGPRGLQGTSTRSCGRTETRRASATASRAAQKARFSHLKEPAHLAGRADCSFSGLKVHQAQPRVSPKPCPAIGALLGSILVFPLLCSIEFAKQWAMSFVTIDRIPGGRAARSARASAAFPRSSAVGPSGLRKHPASGAAQARSPMRQHPPPRWQCRADRICRGHRGGDRLGRDIRSADGAPGRYVPASGRRGSAMLVLQTVLPARSRSPTGLATDALPPPPPPRRGTQPVGPPFEFLKRRLSPIVGRMGRR